MVGEPAQGPRADRGRCDHRRHRGPRVGGHHPRSRGRTGAVPLALDRQERGQGTISAVKEVEQEHGLRVAAIVRLTELTDWLAAQGGMQESLAAVRKYRSAYGA